MRLTVLGSGSAFSTCGCNAGYLVDKRVLIDCGAPVTALMRRAAASANDLLVILLTHFHADHTFTIPTLLGARAFDRTPVAGLVIAGPVGTREYVGRLLGDGYGAHIARGVADVLEPRYVVLQDGTDVELGGYRVESHAVVHSTGPSLAYKLTDSSGVSVGFSGDSELCAGLLRSIAGCDLYVCECTGWDKPESGGHLWRDEVAGLVADHPGTQFLLSHLSERRRLPGALVAHDLLSLEISSAAP